MLEKFKQVGAKGKMASVLVLLVMLPAIFYSVYEFTTLSRSEELIGDVYRQQLDVVLYSLNQYSWDVANSWANTVNDAISYSTTTGVQRQSVLADFLKENTGIRYVFVSSGTGSSPEVFRRVSTSDAAGLDQATDIAGTLKQNADVVDRLTRLQATGYRKIEPLLLGTTGGSRTLALIFVGGKDRALRSVIGLVIDEERFVRDVLGRKMVEAAGNNFLLLVNRKSSNRIVYATEETVGGEAQQMKDLWLFPDFSIGIRLRGETIDEVVRSRFYRNLLLIGLLNVILVAGVWVVYRTVLREIELAQLKSDFVSNISHEIKTPLALIRMFGETLQMNRVKSAAKRQEYYNTIVQETERLTRLINNILDFSRMEAGRKEYRFTSVNLNDIVGNVLKNYNAHLEHEGFTVAANLAQAVPPIEADTGAVSEAILNLVDNAVKYSRKEKYLALTTGKDRATVFVEIEDHGVGIDPKQQTRIFEKFYRVSSGLVQNTRGTGLGLALVKHIVDAHKGKISLRSEPGKGSTFRLSFPVVPDRN